VGDALHNDSDGDHDGNSGGGLEVAATAVAATAVATVAETTATDSGM
jgi:hypothetical protein